MRKFLLPAFVFIFLSGNLLSQNLPAKDSLLHLLSKLKQQNGVNSIIAGVWKGDHEILTTAIGESMTGVTATTDMHIRIGGVSETFFGTLVMMLVDQGKIHLNDTINKWLPDLLAAKRVTVEMLLKSTSGYKDYVLNQDFINLITKEPFRLIRRKEIIDYATSDGKLEFQPGTQQHYSHTNFTILAEVMERATGKTMAQLYKENIFDPLSLTQTGYNSETADLPSPVVHAFSTDRDILEDATFWSPSWTGESGPVYSTIDDLGKWARIFGTGSLLKPESFKELTVRPACAKRSDLYFASGFVVANGWYVQNPKFNGYSGGFGYLPSKDLTVIVYTTQTTSSKENKAFVILKELVKALSPEQTINL